VTAPRFVLDPGSLDRAGVGSTLLLDGAEGRHAATVRRIRPGEQVDVLDGSGTVARCEVVSAGSGRLDLRVVAVEVVPEPGVRVVLVQALAKGGRDELAVETATEVGVDAVVPWQAVRSVVVWSGERGERARNRWVATARAAAKQSRRPRIPPVRDTVDTPGLIRLVESATAALVLHEAATDPLTAAPLPDRGELLVVVGPEGGVDPRELDQLVRAGARPVRLGPEVLRSSTAGAAAAVVLAVRTGRW
jgi:16S rRNA (uracil1498-N3)-methyltransferase